MAGDVIYVTSPGQGLAAMPAMQAWQFENLPNDSGTVWAKAVVGKIMLAGTNEPSTIQVAVDADTTDATEPSVIRLNLEGKAQFTRELSLPLKAARLAANRANMWMTTFGPKVVEIKRGDKTVPVWISGNCFRFDANQNGRTVQSWRVTLTVMSAIQLNVKFGDRTYPLRLVDTNGNFIYNDRAKPIIADDMASVVGGDALVIDTGDGQFRQDAEKWPSGHPVRVGGKWYTLTVPADGTSVSADPVKAAMSAVKIAADHWSCRLVSKDTVLTLSGGRDPVDVPAGEYFIQDYTVTGPTAAAARGQKTSVTGVGLDVESNRMKALAFEAGKTTELVVGAPLKANVKSAVAGGNVIFSMVFSDRGGYKVTSMIGNQGRPPAPRFSVVGSGGKNIFQSTLEYG